MGDQDFTRDLFCESVRKIEERRMGDRLYRPWDDFLDPDDDNEYEDLEAWRLWMREQCDRLGDEFREIMGLAREKVYGEIDLYGLMDDLCGWRGRDD